MRRRKSRLRSKPPPPPPPPPPPTSVEPLPSERGFRIVGDLDIFNARNIMNAVKPQLHGRLVLDFSGVDFIDDSGLGFLVGALKRLRDEGGSLILRNPRPQILRALEITGVAKLPGLTIETDELRGL